MKTKKITSKHLLHSVGFIIMAGLLLVGLASGKHKQAFTMKVDAAVACPSASASGSATTTTNVAAAGTYYLWSRISVPSNADSYYLKVDSTCYKVVGSNLSPNTYGWVNFENATQASVIKLALATGQHNIGLIGNEDQVKVNRLIFTVDANCKPTGNGDNCANPVVDAPPTVSISTPSDNSTVSGIVPISATAVDDVKISRVDFYLDNVLLSTKTVTPYSYNWDTTTTTNGAHTLRVSATDSANQTVNTTLSLNVQQPPPPTGTVHITSPVSGSAVSGSGVAFTSGTTNLSSITKMEYLLDQASIIGTATTAQSSWAIQWDSTKTANGNHTVISRATAGGKTYDSTPLIIVVNNPTGDTKAPSTSGGLKLTKLRNHVAVLSWVASSDNVKVVNYYIYLNNRLTAKLGSTATSYTYSNLVTRTNYTVTVIAVDAASNQSVPASINFKTKTGCLATLCL